MNHCQGEKRGRDVCVTHIIPGIYCAFDQVELKKQRQAKISIL